MQYKTIIENTSADREGWLAARKDYITASDIVCLLGKGFLTPLELALDKLGRREPTESNRLMEMGLVNEPLIARWCSEALDRQLVEMPGFYASVEVPWAAATPDYALAEQGDTNLKIASDTLLEIKQSSSRMKDDWSETHAPDYAVLQANWQCGVLGVKEFYIGGSFRDDPSKLFTPRFDFDNEAFEMMLKKAAEFRSMLSSGQLPEPRANDLDILRKEMPLKAGEKYLLAEEAAAIVPMLKEYKAIQAEKSKIDKESRELDKKLKDIKAKARAASAGKRRVFVAGFGEIKVSEVNVKPRDGYTYERITIKENKQ